MSGPGVVLANSGAVAQRIVSGDAEARGRAGAEASGSANSGIVIPRILHFYWVGRDIGQDAVDNINKWASRAMNSGWQIFLWHDGAGSDAKSHEGMNGSVQVLRIKESDIHSTLREPYQIFIQAGNYPGASDLARYSILLEYGGVYADVGIGPGELDFSAPLRIAGELPIKFGPRLRDGQAVKDVLEDRGDIAVTAEAVQAAAARRREDGAFGNHFIMSPRKSHLMEKLVFLIAAELAVLRSELTALEAFLITGQGAVAKHLNQNLAEWIRAKYMKRELITPDQVIGRIFDQLVTDLPLEWVRPDSEDQT